MWMHLKLLYELHLFSDHISPAIFLNIFPELQVSCAGCICFLHQCTGKWALWSAMRKFFHCFKSGFLESMKYSAWELLIQLSCLISMTNTWTMFFCRVQNVWKKTASLLWNWSGLLLSADGNTFTFHFMKAFNLHMWWSRNRDQKSQIAIFQEPNVLSSIICKGTSTISCEDLSPSFGPSLTPLHHTELPLFKLRIFTVVRKNLQQYLVPSALLEY